MSNLRDFHKYFGLIFAYFGFFLFFSGTLAYYRSEITLFMQDKFYDLKYENSDFAKLGTSYLSQNHATADVWSISVPTSLRPYISVSFNEDATKPQNKHSRVSIALDPQTGEKLELKNTAGGRFLGAIHYHLYLLDTRAAREIVGYASFLMLFLLITGLIIHKRIFKDFFTLRRKWVWRDLHILSSLAGFSIFVLLTISGIWLVERFMHSSDFMASLQNNTQNFTQNNTNSNAQKGEQTRKENGENSHSEKSINKNAQTYKGEKPQKIRLMPEISQIEKILEIAKNEGEITQISINRVENSASMQVNFKNEKLFSENGVSSKIRLYDLQSGKIIRKTDERKATPVALIGTFMKAFHVGNFGGELGKFLFFIFGILGCIMTIMGPYIWEMRKQKSTSKAVVKCLNMTFFVGLFFALAAFFIASFVIDYGVKNRVEMETNTFFLAIFVPFLLSFVKDKGYFLSSALTSISFFAVVILSGFKGAIFNQKALIIWLSCLVLAFIFGFLALKFKREKR